MLNMLNGRGAGERGDAEPAEPDVVLLVDVLQDVRRENSSSSSLISLSNFSDVSSQC